MHFIPTETHNERILRQLRTAGEFKCEPRLGPRSERLLKKLTNNPQTVRQLADAEGVTADVLRNPMVALARRNLIKLQEDGAWARL